MFIWGRKKSTQAWNLLLCQVEDALYSFVSPSLPNASDPYLVAYSKDACHLLGLTPEECERPEFPLLMSGQAHYGARYSEHHRLSFKHRFFPAHDLKHAYSSPHRCQCLSESWCVQPRICTLLWRTPIWSGNNAGHVFSPYIRTWTCLELFDQV